MVDDVDDTDQSGASHARRHRWWWVVGLLVVAGLVLAWPLLRSYREVERVGTDVAGARDRLATMSPSPDATVDDLAEEPAGEPSSAPSATATATPSDPATPTPGELEDEGAEVDAPTGVVDGGYESYLVVGSDARAGLGGSRADVIMLGLVPDDGADPILFSLPRDLWLPDPCRGGSQRINAAYNGCRGVANGFELTSIVVEDFTGIQVDNVVGIDFEGFKDVIDAVGGVRICVDHPVRDGRLSLPAGCTLADGTQALAWVRSRKTQEFVDGAWRPMPGVSDLTRNRRQRDLMVQLLGRVGSFGTVGNLYSFADGVSDSVSLGSGVSAVDGARVAWGLRGRAGDMRRFTIPVTDRVTRGGAQVLVPTEPFATTFQREVGVDLSSLASE